jgi:transposase
VLDAAGSERTVVLADGDGGPTGLLFTAMQPQRVSGLILVNTTARYVRADDYPMGIPPEAVDGLVERLRARWGTAEAARLGARVKGLAPALLTLRGVAAPTAAKIVAEVADVRRFRSKDAFARHNGTAPVPVWSGNRERHRLSRTGNRQLNAAIHRIAVTQKRCHRDAQAYLDRRTAGGNTATEALRALKRHLSDIVYRALLADVSTGESVCVDEAA